VVRNQEVVVPLPRIDLLIDSPCKQAYWIYRNQIWSLAEVVL
jgi:hypothetical protein